MALVEVRSLTADDESEMKWSLMDPEPSIGSDIETSQIPTSDTTWGRGGVADITNYSTQNTGIKSGKSTGGAQR